MKKNILFTLLSLIFVIMISCAGGGKESSYTDGVYE